MDTIEQQSQGQPPSSVEQATPLPTLMMVDTATSAPPPADTSALEEPARRLRLKLPDMPLFMGKRSCQDVCLVIRLFSSGITSQLYIGTCMALSGDTFQLMYKYLSCRTQKSIKSIPLHLSAPKCSCLISSD